MQYTNIAKLTFVGKYSKNIDEMNSLNNSQILVLDSDLTNRLIN